MRIHSGAVQGGGTDLKPCFARRGGGFLKIYFARVGFTSSSAPRVGGVRCILTTFRISPLRSVEKAGEAIALKKIAPQALLLFKAHAK